MRDHSEILPVCRPFAHFLEFFCVHGAPANRDSQRRVKIIINQGYATGFCPKRLLPVWAAYQVSAAAKSVDYARPKFFYDDPRLEPKYRIGAEPFGTIGDQSYGRGHMVPNYAINTQYGRVAQAETFFMSNIIPQHSATNKGAWGTMERAIISAYAPLRKHVWALVGPIFGPKPQKFKRKCGRDVPIPESYYMILADPELYPYDDPDNMSILALRMPYDFGDRPLSDELVTTISDIENATGLSFFPRLSRADKAKLENQTSPTLWPFEALKANPTDPLMP